MRPVLSKKTHVLQVPIQGASRYGAANNYKLYDILGTRYFSKIGTRLAILCRPYLPTATVLLFRVFFSVKVYSRQMIMPMSPTSSVFLSKCVITRVEYLLLWNMGINSSIIILFQVYLFFMALWSTWYRTTLHPAQ